MNNCGLKAYLDGKNAITIVTDKESSFTINGSFLGAYFAYRHNQFIIYKAHHNININETYIIKDEFENASKLEIRYFTKTNEFDDMFYYDKDDLGPTYSKEKTTFKLWAPIASKVVLQYEVNNEVLEEVMERKDKGVFEVTINKDLAKALYVYKVTNNSKTEIVLDPYAYSSSANSKKSAVIDLSLFKESKKTNIKELKSVSEAIIYELSVRDFSMDGTLGNDVKGLFNAFLKHGIKTEKGNPVGIDYIKELGVTHVQLMPIFDFVTVNETNISERYNWGYDPFCYNVLEGSFASTPNNPYSRIKEAKAMIDEFHKNGIRVNVDVVFNHTYSFIDSNFNKLVPNYYYLMDDNGNLSNGSFCGNDIDTTRKMVHKYFVDMCKRYVNLYHIDGIRFDLMGILTKELIMDIYQECKQLNPSFMVYGEGWNMPSMLPEYRRASLNNANQIPNIAFFNDYFRDIVSGKSYNNFSNQKGYLAGNTDLFYEFVKSMRGSVEKGCYFQNASSSINYCECHDNFTLYDKLKITNFNNTEIERNKIQLCCIAATLLAEGIPFLHCGVEFNRTKFGVENSYNASDEINMIRWNNIDIYEKNINAVKDFIKIRKEFTCFKEISRKSICNTIDAQIEGNVLSLTYAYEGELVVLLFNPSTKKQRIDLKGEYRLYANTFGLVKSDDKSYKQISVAPYEFLMLIK